jgi:hypothetical protein
MLCKVRKTRDRILISVPENWTLNVIANWYDRVIKDSNNRQHIDGLGDLLLFQSGNGMSESELRDRMANFAAGPEESPDGPQICIATAERIAEGWDFPNVMWHFVFGRVGNPKTEEQRECRNVRASNKQNGIRVFITTNTERDRAVKKARKSEVDFMKAIFDNEEIMKLVRDAEEKLRQMRDEECV